MKNLSRQKNRHSKPTEQHAMHSSVVYFWTYLCGWLMWKSLSKKRRPSKRPCIPWKSQSGCIISIALVYSLAQNFVFHFHFSFGRPALISISSLSNVSYETRFVIIVYTKLVLFFVVIKIECVFFVILSKKNVERETTTMSSTAAAVAAAAEKKMVRIILMPDQQHIVSVYKNSFPSASLDFIVVHSMYEIILFVVCCAHMRIAHAHAFEKMDSAFLGSNIDMFSWTWM